MLHRFRHKILLSISYTLTCNVIAQDLYQFIFLLSVQDYIFTGAADTPYVPFQQNQYINPSDIIPFRQSPAGFQTIDPSSGYLHPDLQTSDLPAHLQHTLPQYRFSTPSPINNVSTNRNKLQVFYHNPFFSKY